MSTGHQILEKEAKIMQILMELQNNEKELYEKLKYYCKNEEFSVVRECSIKLLEEDETSFIANFFMGEIAFKEGRILESENYYKKAFKVNPDHADLLCSLGIVNFIKNNLDTAKIFFSKALQIEPRNFDLNYNYTIFLCKLESFADAIKYAEICLSLTPDAINILILTANLYEINANLSKALEVFRKLHKLEPENKDHVNKIIDTLKKQNNMSELASFYQELIDSDEDNLSYYLGLSGLLKIQNNPAGCAELNRKAAIKYPNNRDILFDLSASLYELSNFSEATIYIKKLKLIDKDNIKIYDDMLMSMETNLPNIEVNIGTDIKRHFNGSWYRGEHTNYLPSKKNLSEENAIDDYILKGRVPKKPFIDKSMKITTFGSCFARNVTEYLKFRGYAVMGQDMHINSHVVRCGEGMVNTFAILQQFEWAYENKQFSEDLWFGSDKEIATYDAQIRETTKEIFDQTEIFIITLGLSEVWYNKKTEEVFWRAIPKENFNEEIHGFRITTVEENKNNIEKIYNVIRKHRPDAAIIFTLSPIPLNATFRPISCLSANSVSKSILRAALDEVITKYEKNDDKLIYYPSYEIVKDYFVDSYIEDNRHVKTEIIQKIMEKFEQHFCVE